LLLYGSQDTVQPIEDVKQFYRYVGSKEKSSFIFKNGYHHLHEDESAEKEVFPKIVEWIFDLSSNKNSVKWGVTAPLNLRVVKKIPDAVKYAVLVLLPLIVGLLLRLLSCLRRARAATL
jgi:hypothetical protein